MRYNYSLIIPHYNIPKLLRRLLSTVPKREDMQVIVVDDCSTKEVEELVKVKEDYPWVEWYNTGTNGGGGKARNIGLEKAKGKYILFADADDYYEPIFNNILDDYCEKEFDIVYFKGESKDSNTNKSSFRTDHLNRYIEDYASGKDKRAFQLRFLFGEPWCRIISKNLIDAHNIRFDEIPIHNDTKFAYLIGYYSQIFSIDERPLYCVTTRTGSVSGKESTEAIKTRIRVFSEAEKFLAGKRIDNFSREHYLQLVRLLANGKIKTFGEGSKIIKEYGFSNFHIIKNFTKILMSILLMRIR